MYKVKFNIQKENNFVILDFWFVQYIIEHDCIECCDFVLNIISLIAHKSGRGVTCFVRILY